MAEPNYFLQELNDIYTEVFSLVASKNQDYANQSDPLSTFRKGAEFARLIRRDGSPDLERANRVRLSDKLERYVNLVDKELLGGAPNHETLEDTLKDLINYFAIELAIRRIRTKKEALEFAALKEQEAREAVAYARSVNHQNAKPEPQQMVLPGLPDPVDILQGPRMDQVDTRPLPVFQNPAPLPDEKDEDGWFTRLMK